MKNQNFIFKKPVSLVMVAYNEASHIKKVILEYYEWIYIKLPKSSEFIIYLDNPTDKTVEIVRELAKRIDIIIIKGKKNLGYRKALTVVLKRTKNEIIFYSDSSGKHKAKDFWKLIKYEKKYDIITGFRKNRKDPVIRRIISFGQRLITSSFFFVPFYDFNTGYKVIHRNIIENVLDECKHMKQSFSTELLIRAYYKGFSIKSVPVTFVNRQEKNTGTKYKQLPDIIFKSLKGFIILRFEISRIK